MKELNWYEKISKGKHNPGEGDQVHLGKHIEDTYQWINEIALELDITDRKDQAYQALRSVLYVLRDRLTHEELFQFSAQLPMLIRGLIFEGYHYAGKPDKFHVDELLDRVDEGMGQANEIEPEVVFSAVLKVLYKHVSQGEMDDIYAMMPKDIRELWDEAKEIFKVK